MRPAVVAQARANATDLHAKVTKHIQDDHPGRDEASVLEHLCATRLVHGFVDEIRKQRDAFFGPAPAKASQPIRQAAAARSTGAGPGLAETAVFIITGQRAEALEKLDETSYHFVGRNGPETIKVRNAAPNACEVDQLLGTDHLVPD